MSFAAWRVDNSGFYLHARGAGRVLPVRGHFMSVAWRRDPQHFHRVCTGVVRFCTSDPHACPQKAGKQSCCRAGGERRVSVPGVCVTRPARRTRGPAPGPDEIVQEGRHRMLAAALPDRRIRRPPGGRAHPHPPRTARPRYAQAAPLVTPCLRDHRHRLAGNAPVPSTAGFSSLSPESNGPCRAPAAKASRCCHRPSVRLGRRKGDRHLLHPPPQDANPVRGRRDQQGLPAHLTTRCRHPGTSTFQVFPLSTRYPQNAGSYPHSAAVIHRLIHSPSTGYRM